MTFLAPAWLFALVPWGAFAAWLLVGRRKRQWVPFLDLWDAPDELRKPKKGFEPPPLALVFALLATLLALLAVARPHFTPPGRGVDRGGVTIVVDRGDSMSAVVDGQPRFVRLARDAAPALIKALGPGSVDLVDALDGRADKTDRAAWPELVGRQKRTDADTTAALLATLRPLLQRGTPTILLSDRDLHIKDDQLVQVMPTVPVQNAGLVALAARPGQVMVGLRSTGGGGRTLRLRSGDREVTKRIDLIPGVEQKIFIDFDSSADLIEAALVEPDDFDGDDRAWLVRSRPWPRVEPRLALAEELRRMLDVYARHRAASASSSPTVALARPGELKPDESGVLFAPTAPPESAQGELHTSPHPILTGVDLTSLTRGASVSARGPGEGWTILTRLGGKPILAVRDGEHRQAWVGFESREFARTPSFVVLWTNVLDWAGAGGEGFSSVAPDLVPSTAKRVAPGSLPTDVDPAHWPGVFETPQGQVACNPGAAKFAVGGDDWRSALARLRLPPGTGIDLTRWLALGALACVAIAAATWERRRVPAPRPPAHLDVESVTRVQTTFAADGHVHRHETTMPPR